LNSWRPSPIGPFNADFEKPLRGKERIEPDWYKPGHSGARSIHEMAKKLGRLADYHLVYKYLSYFTHGSRFQLHTRVHSNNTIEIEPIRYLKDFPLALSTIATLGMRTYRAVIEEYRLAELDQFTTTVREDWAPRLECPAVEIETQTKLIHRT
jgi:hypothetical protein